MSVLIWSSLLVLVLVGLIAFRLLPSWLAMRWFRGACSDNKPFSNRAGF